MSDLSPAQDENDIYASEAILFDVGGQTFGTDIVHITEIIKPTEIKKLPMSPAAVEGVFRLRDNVFPLIDIAKLLGRTRNEDDIEEQRFIIVQWAGTSLALHVDRILHMHGFTGGDIQAIDDTLSKQVKDYVTGQLSSDTESFHLLNSERIVQDLKTESEQFYA